MATPDPAWLWPALAATGALLLGILVSVLVALRRGSRQRERIAALSAQVKSQNRLDEERDVALALARERLGASFAEAASESLRRSGEQFLALARENLGQYQKGAQAHLEARENAIEAMIKPVREALADAARQIADVENQRREAYGSIHRFLRDMGEQQRGLRAETQRLVGALKRPEVRGQWGELSLRRLVELAGMTANCDFTEQTHLVTDDGSLRPDMIIRLPESRELIVDVKTPLDGYLQALEADDDDGRRAGLHKHLLNLRERIRQLGAKAYWSQFRHTPEFVILFIPGDQFLAAALDQDPELIDTALQQKVILATPTSFIALLKSVAYGWRQLALAENAERIRDLAEDLHKRIVVFTRHMATVGKHLGGSVDAYNRAVGSLERNVLPGARKFGELGVAPHDDIPELKPLEKAPRPVTATDDTDAT